MHGILGFCISLAISSSPAMAGVGLGRGHEIINQVPASITAEEKYRIERESVISSLAVSQDGQLLATADKAGGIILSDAISGKEKKRLKCDNLEVGHLVFAPDGLHLLATVGKAIKLWEIRTGQEKWSVENVGTPIGFHAEGKQVLTSKLGAIQVRQAADGVPIREFRANPGMFGLNERTLSADGKLLAAAYSVEKVIKIWSIDAAEELAVMKGHADVIQGLCFTRSKKWIATASWDKTVRIWDTKTGNLIQNTATQKTPIRVAYSPDEKLLAIGFAADSKEISIRDSTSMKEILALVRPKGSTTTVCFLPNGNFLVATTGRVVQVWELSTK